MLLGLGVSALEDSDPMFQPRGMRNRWPLGAGEECLGRTLPVWSRCGAEGTLCGGVRCRQGCELQSGLWQKPWGEAQREQWG